MSEQVIMMELEASAEILLAPPNVINSEQRHCAESVFLNFQKTKSPFHLCQFILANSKSDYVQFQAASLLKQATIREWRLMDKPTIVQLRTGLLNFVIQNLSLQNYVREQLLLVVAIMVKRSSVDDKSEIVAEFLTEVSRLISSGECMMQTIGCSILTALLNEFSSSTRASDVGLTWEAHLIAKKKFERTDLKRLFQFCLQGLSELNKVGPPIPAETSKLFKKFLIIAEQVLTWNFQFAMLLPRKLVGMFESQQCPALRPNCEWHDVFLDPNVIGLFFKLHWQVRDIPDLCHHTMQCFHQLASLNGIVMNKKEDRCSYLRWFIENLLQLLSSGPLKDYETIGISNMISRLHVFFPPYYMSTLPTEVLQGYLVRLSDLTCLFTERAAQEESQEETVYMEAFDHITEAWSTILQDSQFFPPELNKQCSIQIFNHYLKAHLSPPDGIRLVGSANDEIDEIEEDDRVKFRDQLSSIGRFGRMITDHSIPILIRLLEDRISRLHGQLQRILQLAGTANDTSILDSLNEDIHWLVMIAGHVLTSVSEGETSLIPMEIIRFCVTQQEHVNVETTLRVLASPTQRTSDIPGGEVASDPVVRLISTVFRLCEVEKRALEANLAHLLSPEVGLTLVWFLLRFSVSYLLPNETYYTEMSLILTQAFGKDTDAGLWTLDFVIAKLETNFSLWSSESKLVTDTAYALTTVLNNTERGDKAIRCASLINLVKKQASGAYHNLPTAAKRSILKSLVIVGTANKVVEVKENYWKELLTPIQDRFQTVMCSSTFPQTYQTKEVQAEIRDLIECLTGIVDGCTLSNLSDLLPVLNPMFEDLVKLVDIYHNYNEVVVMVFQVFCVAAKRILCNLNQAGAKILYECCVNMIRAYAKHNTGKLSREASAEEEQYQDILLLMQLLTDLLFKDIIDFPFTNDSDSSETEATVTAADVSLYGLSIIMPLMSADLLNFPSLCSQYFKLVWSVCEAQPAKICRIPSDLLKSLLSSIEFGLTSYTSDVSGTCFDFISFLALHVYQSNLQGTPVHAALEPFLKLIFDMLLHQPLDADLTQSASGTLYTLVCCFQTKYKELVQELIDNQSDPGTAQRLLTSFNSLSSSMTLSLDRHSRIKFREDFEKFITEVRGYLCVK